MRHGDRFKRALLGRRNGLRRKMGGPYLPQEEKGLAGYAMSSGLDRLGIACDGDGSWQILAEGLPPSIVTPIHKELGVRNPEAIALPPIALLGAKVAEEIKDVASDGVTVTFGFNAVSAGGHFLASGGIPGFERHFAEACLEMVACDG